jgi:ABC-type phosphate transport system permease subunit
MNKRTRKKKNRFSKFIVTVVILLNILFTAAVLYVFLQTGSEPMTLIGCWFAFTTGELWMLSSIKKTKVNKRDGESNE